MVSFMLVATSERLLYLASLMSAMNFLLRRYAGIKIPVTVNR